MFFSKCKTLIKSATAHVRANLPSAVLIYNNNTNEVATLGYDVTPTARGDTLCYTRWSYAVGEPSLTGGSAGAHDRLLNGKPTSCMEIAV